ncbi:DUF2243 domain-containing protein [Achromobacter piechaudii]|uniref:DUF2243 domain-containing protein n=1 Tax=Achromobacter piechaudii TaxID=72556 RepID=A0A6S7E4C1_9BURK|nr:DUF2243 domain-containing protein [Achromobacter piechaudii]CAB3895423.1 hypothetical protein LMG1861_04028 [Achromobacter piechaudii]
MITALPRRRPWAGFLLGFGMGGFFDGILLHQILQWHHLLSGLTAPALADLRVQVVADGAFHALMYVVAGVGLWGLYRSRGSAVPPRKLLLAAFLLGFGAWHVTDAVLSHWLVGLHRLRMDVADPLPWELAWLGIFGVVPLLAGWLLRRPGPPPPATGGGALTAVLAVVVTTAAALNLYPVSRPAQDTSVVVLRPGAGPAGLLTALDGTAARVVWSDASGAVWVLADARPTTLLALFGSGAMYVSGASAPGGCSAWIAPAPGGAV